MDCFGVRRRDQMDRLTVAEPRIELLGMPLDAIGMDRLLGLCDRAIAERRSLSLGMVNVAKLVNSRKDRLLYKSVATSDVVVADGQGVVLLSRLAGKPLPERVAGIDVMAALMELADSKRYRIFFLGARPDVVDAVVERARGLYPGLIIAGQRDGYFDLETQAEEVAYQVAESRADILFVAITAPKKEFFIDRWKGVMEVPVCHGVGGSFDVFAGHTKRAPVWMQRAGLEWLYRVLQEPRRMWKRYLVTNTAFLFLSVREIISSRLRPPKK